MRGDYNKPLLKRLNGLVKVALKLRHKFDAKKSPSCAAGNFLLDDAFQQKRLRLRDFDVDEVARVDVAALKQDEFICSRASRENVFVGLACAVNQNFNDGILKRAVLVEADCVLNFHQLIKSAVLDFVVNLIVERRGGCARAFRVNERKRGVELHRAHKVERRGKIFVAFAGEADN